MDRQGTGRGDEVKVSVCACVRETCVIPSGHTYAAHNNTSRVPIIHTLRTFQRNKINDHVENSGIPIYEVESGRLY